METNRRGLGRGLEALIPDTTALRPEESDRILSLPIEAIRPNPHQPRRDFPADDLDALAESIRAQGLLQPVVVRPATGGVYELVAGERRWRAAARAGFERVPALVRKTQDEEMLPLALVENLLRQDLNPIEEAEAYTELVTEEGWTQEGLALKVGKSRAHVANTMRLLRLPEDIRAEIASGVLTAGHARALLACESEEALQALRRRILGEGLTVREAERVASPQPAARVRRHRGPGRTTDRSPSPETRDLEERLQRLFGTAVRIEDRGGRGRLSFEFFSYDDLARLTDLLLAAGDRSPLAPRG
jgi:ParB family chromosome partitioning protein